MDKHDKHNKPGKSHGKAGKAAPAKADVAVAAPVEKGKGDWPGKPSGKK
jgi:hypothetical protein